MSPREFARSSLDAFEVMHRAYMSITVSGNVIGAIAALHTLAHAQAFVLRTGLEPTRRARP